MTIPDIELESTLFGLGATQNQETSIWLVYNKVISLPCANEETADKLIASAAPSVGLRKTKSPLISYPETTPAVGALEPLQDQLVDLVTQFDLLREALGVPIEPHQTLFDRMLERAQTLGKCK